MVQLKVLLTQLFKASMRRSLASQAKSRAGVLALFLIPLFLGIDHYLGRVDEAAHYLAMGEYDRANQLSFQVYMAWLCLPLLLLGGGLDSSSLQRLARLPLTQTQAFVVGLIDLLGSPFFYFLLAATLALYPLARVAPSGDAALLGFFLFCLACIATLLASSHGLALLNANAQLRRMIVLGPLAIVLIIAILALESHLPQRRFILATLEQPPIQDLSILALGTLVLSLIALRCFRALNKAIHNANATNGQQKPSILLKWLPLLPITNAHNLRLDLMHAIKTPETSLALIMAMGACAFLLDGKGGLAQGFVMAQQITIILATPMLSNLFGRDGNGLIRYQLMPLSGRQILLSKHLAILIPTVLILLPIWICAAIAIRPSILVAALLQSLTAFTLLAALGIHTSLSDPVPRTFAGNVRGFRSVLNNLILYGLTIGISLLPAISAWGDRDESNLLPLLIATPIALVLYLLSLHFGGKHFENHPLPPPTGFTS